MTATTRASSHREQSREASNPPENSEDHDSRQPRHASPSKATSTSAERPVRKQLKNTSITAASPSAGDNVTGDASSDSGSVDTDNSKASPESLERGRKPKKKRSYDEVDAEVNDSKRTATSKHLRKRSKSGHGDSGSSHERDGEAGIAEGDTMETGLSQDKPLVDESEHVPLEAPTDEEPPSVEADSASKVTEARAQTPVNENTENSNLDSNLPTSPPNKRTREQFAHGQHEDHAATTSKVLESTSASSEKAPNTHTHHISSTEEPERKRSREDKDREPQPTKIAPSSGFSNFSTQSPFSSLAPTKPEDSSSQTSPKAFASSGFASFASTSQSAFGTLGGKSSVDGVKKKETESTEAFGTNSGSVQAESGKSAFASTTPSLSFANGFGSASGFGFGSVLGSTSGFGALSNGFGQSGASAPLTSFASSNAGSAIIGSSGKPTKAFGAPADEDEDEEGETSETEDHAIKAVADNDQKDPRFFEQDVETGEEGEETVYATRAKLYVNAEKQWKERSVGVFKVNIAYGDGNGVERAKTARFIMRADGSHRISLNSAITREIEIKDPSGGPPKGKNAIFLGFIDGKPMLMQLKMKTPQQTIEFYEAVTALQAEL